MATSWRPAPSPGPGGRRRRPERGAVATLSDIAPAEQVTPPFVSRTIRLAYHSPAVLERLLVYHHPSVLRLDKLDAASLAAGIALAGLVFED